MKRRACVLGGLGLGAAALLRVTTACGPTEIADRRRELMQSWGEAFLLASYSELETLCAELEARMQTLRDAPDLAALEEAQAAWIRARAPWKQTEVFAFGPFSEAPARLGAEIDFWPARPETVQAELAGSEELTVESAARLGAPAKGFHALEYLLFEPDVELVEAFATDPRRGDYALAVAHGLAVDVRRIWEAWHPDYGNFLGELTAAGRGSTHYETLDDALGEIVNRMGFTLENMRGEKLAKPLGDSAGGVPQPDQAESPFSTRSLDDLRDNLQGIEILYFGSQDGSVAALDDYLHWRGRNLTLLFRARLDACHAAIDAVPAPLETAVSSDPASLRALMDRLAELQRTVQVDVINALSLSVGFNDNDGD